MAACAAVFASGVPRTWQPPASWLPGARCIHYYETRGQRDPWHVNTGNGYYGGMQFTLSTWRSVGGTVRPDRATAREQLYRAWLVWTRDGGSFREWGTAHYCGVR